MTGGIQARREARSIRSVAAIALMMVIVILVSSALMSGTSLDDYWTLYLADPHLGFAQLIGQRWIQDIHPPIFDAWASILSRIGMDSVPIGRLISNLPALILLVYAARSFAKRLPDQAAFYAMFLLLMLSAPAVIKAFGVYRGDFWQIAAFGGQMMLARHIMYVENDYRTRRDGGLALIGLVATLAAITLDYGGALFGGIVAMATMLAAIARGLRRWARSLLLVLALSIGVVIYTISWQGPAWAVAFDLYQNWIEMDASTAGGILFALLFGTLLHNPVAVAGAWLGREHWTKHDSAFALLVGIALAASLVAIGQIDAQRRLITPSNTSDIAVMVTALMAAAGAKIAERRLWMYVLAGVSVFSSLVALIAIGLDGGWQTGAKKVARVVESCPSTRVFVASGWRLDDGTRSRAARREERVFQLGYKRQGKAHGFTPIMIHPAKPQLATPGACPTLLWIEQVPERKRLKPDRIIRATGLTGLAGAKLSVIRTHSGLILRAER